MIDPNTVNFISLSTAVLHNDGEGIRALLSRPGPRIWCIVTRWVASFSEWDTPLCAAIQMGHKDAIDALLESGWNPNEVSRHGDTPLHEAVFSKNVGVAIALIRHGARPKSDNTGMDPVQWARSVGYHDLADLVVQEICAEYRETDPEERAYLYHGVKRFRPI